MKKVVPHDRPLKWTKSKGWSVRKQKPTKPAQKVVQPRSSGHPPLGMSRCFIVYSSSMCCYTQLWGGTSMNMCYWSNMFAYSGWGHHKFCLLTCWSGRHGRRRCNLKRPLYIRYLYYLITRVDDLYWAESLLREQNNSWDLLFLKCVGAFSSPSYTKRQGAYVEHQKWRMVWPLGPGSPRAPRLD
jgi:hypothetical protein